MGTRTYSYFLTCKQILPLVFCFCKPVRRQSAQIITFELNACDLDIGTLVIWITFRSNCEKCQSRHSSVRRHVMAFLVSYIFGMAPPWSQKLQQMSCDWYSIIDIFNSVITVNEFINSRAKLQLIYYMQFLFCACQTRLTTNLLPFSLLSSDVRKTCKENVTSKRNLSNISKSD